MKKRAYERIPLDMKVEFLQSDLSYSGTLKNISQNGMYIETSEPLPFNSTLDIHIPFKSKLKILIDFNNNVLEVPVKVRRLVQEGAFFTGMGVMLMDTSQNYLDFMSSLVTSR